MMGRRPFTWGVCRSRRGRSPGRAEDGRRASRGSPSPTWARAASGRRSRPRDGSRRAGSAWSMRPAGCCPSGRSLCEPASSLPPAPPATASPGMVDHVAGVVEAPVRVDDAAGLARAGVEPGARVGRKCVESRRLYTAPHGPLHGSLEDCEDPGKRRDGKPRILLPDGDLPVNSKLMVALASHAKNSAARRAVQI